MQATELYCPECEQRHTREWMGNENGVYHCYRCGKDYTATALREAYESEARDLESDAAFIRQRLEMLAA